MVQERDCAIETMGQVVAHVKGDFVERTAANIRGCYLIVGLLRGWYGIR